MSAAAPDVLQALLSRHSVGPKHLVEPGPDEAQLQRMVEAALRGPDHGELVPFRFKWVGGEARERMAALFAAAARRAGKAAPGQEGPDAAQAPDVLAVVFAKQGDTFAGLSARFYEGNPDLGPAIARANKLPAYQIAPKPGALLVIPNAAAAKDLAA